MHEEIKGLSISTALSFIGLLTRLLFGEKKYTWIQIFGLVLFNAAMVWLIYLSGAKPLIQAVLNVISGLISPNVILAIIRAANKSEGKFADKLSDKADKFTDLLP